MIIDSAPKGQDPRKTRAFLMSAAALILLLVAGAAVDLCGAYLTRAKLSDAVNAGAWAGARHVNMGDREVVDLAVDVARAKYSGGEPVDYAVKVHATSPDTRRVTLSAATASDAYLSDLFGRASIEIRSRAQATRYPLDISLVLDVSYSLARNGTIDILQRAASDLVDLLDEDTDQLGLVTYSTWADEKLPLQKHFAEQARAQLKHLSALADTNVDEGLRLAKSQLEVAPPRRDARKVVVLFTDGRPNAFADRLRFDKLDDGCTDRRPNWFNGIVAAYISGPSYRGLFRASDGRLVRGFNADCTARIATDASDTGSVRPVVLPGGYSVNGYNIRTLGAEQAEQWAYEIRRDGTTVLAIGLGNPGATSVLDVPDHDFLRRLANQNGVVSPSQPHGSMVYASNPAELEDAFLAVGDRILAMATR